MLKSNCRTHEVEFHFYFLTYNHQFVVHLCGFTILNMLFVVLLYCETRKTEAKKRFHFSAETLWDFKLYPNPLEKPGAMRSLLEEVLINGKTQYT